MEKIKTITVIVASCFVVYVGVGNLIHRYIFPEQEPPLAMYPVAGDSIVNDVAGEKIIFLQTGIETNGAHSVREFHLKPGGAVPRAHIHDYDETFRVISGKLTLIWNGVEHILSPGDSLTVPAGDPHQPVNRESSELITINRVAPAGKHDLMLMQTHGFLTEKKTPRSKWEFFLQAMLFVDYYGTYTADLPVGVQKVLSFVIAPSARLAGYKTWRPEYSMRWRRIQKTD
jgi:mannose-6-phosphate isomerase-like protein (cupin superfamily)